LLDEGDALSLESLTYAQLKSSLDACMLILVVDDLYAHLYPHDLMLFSQIYTVCISGTVIQLVPLVID